MCVCVSIISVIICLEKNKKSFQVLKNVLYDIIYIKIPQFKQLSSSNSISMPIFIS